MMTPHEIIPREDLQARMQFEMLLADISSRFTGLAPGDVDREILERKEPMKRNLILALAMVVVLCLTLAGPARGQDPKQMLQEKVAAFKQSMAENQKALLQYTWIEDTQLSLKGEVKSTKIESCRYGSDGKVQKTPLTAPPEKKEMRGL